MNQARRNKLGEVLGMLEQASDILQDVQSDEQDALNNMPENFEGSERYEQMEDAIENLSSAYDSIQDAISDIEEAAE